jgi:hypothetical protein
MIFGSAYPAFSSISNPQNILKNKKNSFIVVFILFHTIYSIQES